MAQDTKANTTWDLKMVLGLKFTRMVVSIKETGKQIEWMALVSGQTKKENLIMVTGLPIRCMVMEFILALLTRTNIVGSFAMIISTDMEPIRQLTDQFTKGGGFKVSNMGLASIKAVNQNRNMDYGTWGSGSAG